MSQVSTASSASNSSSELADKAAGVEDGTDLVTFYRVLPEAIPPMRADRSALGTMPAKAYQYCEALCTASAFGWYAFPAADVRLLFDGTSVHVDCEGEWRLLTSMHAPGVEQWWDAQCPSSLQGMAPPFLTSLGVPGYVQVWTGMLVKSRENWSVLIRPIANVDQTREFQCFEGIVETDQFAPAPLFTNIKIKRTDTVIEIPAHQPLFQVQPLPRESYNAKNLNAFSAHNLFDPETSESIFRDTDWAGYASTIRTSDPVEDMHSLGSYGASSRKRSKREPENR